jgi:hypothetical protein
MPKLLHILAFWIVFLPALLPGQQVQVTGFTVNGDQVEVRYALSDAPRSNAYFVQLFALRGKDTLQLREVTGAVGDSIREGSHLISWNARKEWGRFRGRITFLVKATPYFSFVKPSVDTTVRRGMPFTIQWYGANSRRTELVVELYRFGALVDTLATVQQAGAYTWLIPDKLDHGGGYRIRVTGPLGSGIDQFSPIFTVQRKTNPLIYIGPGAALAGGVLWLLLRKPLPESPSNPD